MRNTRFADQFPVVLSESNLIGLFKLPIQEVSFLDLIFLTHDSRQNRYSVGLDFLRSVELLYCKSVICRLDALGKLSCECFVSRQLVRKVSEP